VSFKATETSFLLDDFEMLCLTFDFSSSLLISISLFDALRNPELIAFFLMVCFEMEVLVIASML